MVTRKAFSTFATGPATFTSKRLGEVAITFKLVKQRALRIVQIFQQLIQLRLIAQRKHQIQTHGLRSRQKTRERSLAAGDFPVHMARRQGLRLQSHHRPQHNRHTN